MQTPSNPGGYVQPYAMPEPLASYTPVMRITRHRGEEGTPEYRRDELELFAELWEKETVTREFTERVINYFTAGLT